LVLTLVFNSCTSNTVKSKDSSDSELPLTGKALFEQNCSACHGASGDSEIGGAANLKTTRLSAQQINKVILHGKGSMPALGSLFSSAERDRIVTYVNQLKN